MKKLTSVLFLLFPFICFSQINFENGYFITNENTKVNCKIKNVDWKNNPRDFEYKLENEEIAKKISISEVKEFMVSDNQYFKRFNVEIDRSKKNISDLSDQKEPLWSKETVFLKVLSEGKLNLYVYNDTGTKFFFYSSNNHENAMQLVFKEYLISDDQIANNNFYKQQIALLMADENFPMEKFSNLTYKQDKILDLFVKYNQIKNPEKVNTYVQNNKPKINLKVITGVNFAKSEYDVIGKKGETEAKSVLKIGFEFEYNLAFNKNKWSIFLEPNFQSYKANGQNNSKLSVDYKFIEIPVGVRHYLFLGESDKSKIFIDAGYAYGFIMNSKFGTTNQKIDMVSDGNIFFGVGYSYSRYSIEFRHNFDRGLIDYNSWYTNYKSSGITVGYKFL